MFEMWMDFSIIVNAQEVIWSVQFQSIKQNMTIESGIPFGNHDAI